LKDEETKEKKRKAPAISWNDFPDGVIPEGELLTKKADRSRILFIALDTECQSNYTANTNLCLSYQYAVYNLFDGCYKSGIFYPDINKQERYSLSQFTKKVLQEINLPISQLQDYRIIYIAHYFTAEWSMFSDRKLLHMKFEYIRKSMTTTNQPLITTIIDESNEEVKLWVDVRDTMLLLPDDYRSLEKASTFIEGYEKIDIGAEHKSVMYQFMQDEPALFEEYAIRDAEVTLKLFVKLQYMLNKINRTETKLFSTLASATTNDFKEYSKNRFGDDEKGTTHKMQFDRWHHLYREYESLADRSYLGGLNSSYHIGKSEGYTFVDIDFKNAYPTAMNLLRVGNFGYQLDKPKKYKRASAIVDLEEVENA
jgi:hypothetical protein